MLLVVEMAGLTADLTADLAGWMAATLDSMWVLNSKLDVKKGENLADKMVGMTALKKDSWVAMTVEMLAAR